jgi:hypothetical protein
LFFDKGRGSRALYQFDIASHQMTTLWTDALFYFYLVHPIDPDTGLLIYKSDRIYTGLNQEHAHYSHFIFYDKDYSNGVELFRISYGIGEISGLIQQNANTFFVRTEKGPAGNPDSVRYWKITLL